MASTSEENLRLELPDVGADRNTWGTILNTVISEIERAITGVLSFAVASSNVTLTTTGAANEEARKAILIPSGTLTGNVSIVAPNEPKMYIVDATGVSQTASEELSIKTPTGAALNLPLGEVHVVYNNPADGSGAGAFHRISALTSGTIAEATNALELGGVVAAAYAQLAVNQAWTAPQTLTPDHVSLTANAYTPDADTEAHIIVDQSEVGAGVTVTINNPTGTPKDGQIMLVDIEQNATTAASVSWGTKFIFPDDQNINLTQTANKVDCFAFQYSSNLDRWINRGATLNLPRS